MILAIDFDDTICDTAHRIAPQMGQPLPGAVKALETWFHAGHTIIVYTARATKEQATKVVEDWLRYYLIPFDEVTAIKPKADIYLDNCAVRFTDWPQSVKIVEQLMKR